MKYILFGGQSSTNQKWLKTFADNIKKIDSSSDFYIHEYLAWSNKLNQDDDTQIKLEIENVKRSTFNKHSDVSVGKSFGCLIALSIELAPEYMVLIGPPIKPLKDLGYKLEKQLIAKNIKTLIIANKTDPTLNIESLKGLSHKLPKQIKIEVLDGVGHQYNDINLYVRLVSEYLNAN